MKIKIFDHLTTYEKILTIYYAVFLGFLLTTTFIDESLFVYAVAGTIVTYAVGAVIVLVHSYNPYIFGNEVIRVDASAKFNAFIALHWPILLTFCLLLLLFECVISKER